MCNRACCSSEVAKEMFISLLITMNHSAGKVGMCLNMGKAQYSENEDHGIQSYHFMGNRWGNSGNSDRLYFGGTPESVQMMTAAIKLKNICSLEEKL